MDFSSIKEVFLGLLLDIFGAIENIIPEKQRVFINPMFFIILISFYGIFVWKFHRLMARKDLLELNLQKYNQTDKISLNKLVEILFFLLEYIIILPFLIFFWFVFLSLFLLLMTKTQTMSQIILLSASVVGAVRVTSYLSEDVSREIAKMLPFTLLALILIDPQTYLFSDFVLKLGEIPSLISNIYNYLIFILAIEITLRVLSLIHGMFKKDEKDEGPDVFEKQGKSKKD
ncbi:MAG: hypothetical protein WC867_06410 [Candidatus Pacearchaeota archaeon]